MMEKLGTGRFLINYGPKYQKMSKLVFPHNLQQTGP